MLQRQPCLQTASSGAAGKCPVRTGISGVQNEQDSKQAGLDTGSLGVKRFEHKILCVGKSTDGYGMDGGGRKAERALSPEHCQMEAEGGWAPSLPEPQRAQTVSWQFWEGGGEKCWKGQD